MRDLDAHVLLHPTYLTDAGLAATTDRHPNAPFYGLTRDRVERYIIPRIDYANREAVTAWSDRFDRDRDPWGPCDIWTGPFKHGHPWANLPSCGVSTHRVVFELELHDVPDDFVARPRCSQNHACVTPRHLVLFRSNASCSKLPRKQLRDLVHLVVRSIEDSPRHLEWPAFEHYGAIYGVSPHTVRYHVHRASSYIAMREQREASRLAKEWR